MTPILGVMFAVNILMTALIVAVLIVMVQQGSYGIAGAVPAGEMLAMGLAWYVPLKALGVFA